MGKGASFDKCSREMGWKRDQGVVTATSCHEAVVTYHFHFEPPAGSDRDLQCWFSRTPNHFLIFMLRTDSDNPTLSVSEQPVLSGNQVQMPHKVCHSPCTALVH